MPIADWADLIGLIGVVIILIAYFLLQVQSINAKKVTYSLLNLFGAILILFSLFVHWNLPSVVIEVFWILISVYGLFRAIKFQKA